MTIVQTNERAEGRVRLERDEVHLWWGGWSRVESLDAARAWLSDEEWRRAERFRREQDSRAFLLRRAFLRRVLARYVGQVPREVLFLRSEFGKPFLARRDAKVCFNATSAGDRFLVVVALDRELGVDLEREERLGPPEDLSRLARRVLSPSEWSVFEVLAEERRAQALLGAWTRKEAVLKALGTGLSREPDTVEVGLGELDPASTAAVPSWSGWGRCFELEAPAGARAALVVTARDDEALRLRLLPPA